MIRIAALFLIAIGFGFAFAALAHVQPKRPAVIPGTLYSTWKSASPGFADREVER